MLDLGNAGLIQEPHQQLTLNKEAAVPKCVNTFTRSSSIMFIITKGNIMLMVPISHHLWSLWQEGDCSHYPCQIRTLDSSFIHHHHNHRAHQVDTVNQKAISFILGRETGFHISLSPRFTAQSLASGTDTSERSCMWKNSTRRMNQPCIKKLGDLFDGSKLVYDVTITWFPMYIVALPRIVVTKQKIQPILYLAKNEAVK